MPIGVSGIARQVDNLKDAPERTLFPVYGLVVHQTGSGLPEKAQKLGRDVLEFAVNYYLNPDSYFAHYVIGYDGEIVQLADDSKRASHVGLSQEDRQLYLTGMWKSKLPFAFVARWQAAWPKYKSPAHLFPGPSVNNAYCGVEMLPLLEHRDNGMRHTDEQHAAVVSLALDLASRWGFPEGWQATGRLVGHEDVNPIQRHTKSPPAGWDPGWLRDKPWFDFAAVRKAIASPVVT